MTPPAFLTRHGRLLLFAITFAMLWQVYHPAIAEWIGRVMDEERYSHVPLVILVTFYLIWQRRKAIAPGNPGAWNGVMLTLLAGIGLLIGELSAIWTIVQYSLVLALAGLAWTLMGNQIRRIAMPMLLFVFTIPLPYMIDIGLSGKMQLLSSWLGVQLLHLLHIVVYLEGNIIDLGEFKLQVLEACSGLNYLFPLMAIGLIFALIYQAPFWARTLIFLSTIPITILMNSFRIAMVGVLVNFYGIGAAQGFMHYFEGWLIFMLCLITLLGEAKLLNRLRHIHTPLANTLSFRLTGSNSIPAAPSPTRKAPIIAALFLIILASAAALTHSQHPEVTPTRQTFDSFPMTIGRWHGVSYPFLNNENSVLHLTDYLQANYQRNDQNINVYIGYVASQHSGFVPHSPKACIPGGGWEILSASNPGIKLSNGKTIHVTRLLIDRGLDKQVVYYWFHQRGRDLGNEYSMKLALLEDAIRINRTDGAIVRLTMPVTQNVETTDKDLRHFLRQIYPLLPPYVPN